MNGFDGPMSRPSGCSEDSGLRGGAVKLHLRTWVIIARGLGQVDDPITIWRLGATLLHIRVPFKPTPVVGLYEEAVARPTSARHEGIYHV